MKKIKAVGLAAVIGLPFCSSAFAISPLPEIASYGSIPFATQEALALRNWVPIQTKLSRTDLHRADFIIANSNGNLTENELQLIRQKFISGQPVLIDGSTASNSTREHISRQITGISLDDSMIAARYRNDRPEFRVLSNLTGREPAAPAFHARAKEPELPTVNMVQQGPLTKEQQERFITEIAEFMLDWVNEDAPAAEQYNDDAYRPELSVPPEVRVLGNRCMVGHVHHWDWVNGVEDACHGNMSVSLYYEINLIRSVPHGGGGSSNADDAKFVRVTLDPNKSGGAGWHLANQPVHKHGFNPGP